MRRREEGEGKEGERGREGREGWIERGATKLLHSPRASSHLTSSGSSDLSLDCQDSLFTFESAMVPHFHDPSPSREEQWCPFLGPGPTALIFSMGESQSWYLSLQWQLQIFFTPAEEQVVPEDRLPGD